MRKRLRIAAIIALMLGLLWTWISRPNNLHSLDLMHPALRVGAPAPDITLAEPGNQKVSLSTLKGKVVVLNFWATWCPPCRIEMGALQQIHQEYAGRNLVVLGVNQIESEQTATKFMQDQNLAFQIALDSDGSASQVYHVTALPTTYFIDKAGIIRNITYGGPMTHALIESNIASLVSP